MSSVIMLAIGQELNRHRWEMPTSIMTTCRPKAHWLSTGMNDTHVQCVAVYHIAVANNNFRFSSSTLTGETLVARVCEHPINVLGIWEAERTFGIGYNSDTRISLDSVRYSSL